MKKLLALLLALLMVLSLCACGSKQEAAPAPAEEAPQTFDFAIAAVVAAVVSLAGYAVSKKH